MNQQINIIFFDTETTGLFDGSINLETAPHCLQLAWIDMYGEHDYIVKHKNIEIPQFITDINKIDAQVLEERGVDPILVLKDFQDALERADGLAAHNMYFDYNIVLVYAYRYLTTIDFQLFLMALTNLPLYCTMKACTHAYPFGTDKGLFRRQSLGPLYKHIFGVNFENAHNGLADARACANIAVKLFEAGIFSAPATSTSVAYLMIAHDQIMFVGSRHLRGRLQVKPVIVDSNNPDNMRWLYGQLVSFLRVVFIDKISAKAIAQAFRNQHIWLPFGYNTELYTFNERIQAQFIEENTLSMSEKLTKIAMTYTRDLTPLMMGYEAEAAYNVDRYQPPMNLLPKWLS